MSVTVTVQVDGVEYAGEVFPVVPPPEPWSPLDLEGLVAWYDGTSEDKSGNGYNLIDGKAANVVLSGNKFSAFTLSTAPKDGNSRLLSYRANVDAGDWLANSLIPLYADVPKNLSSYGSANLSNSSTIPVVGYSHGGVQQLNQPLMADVILRMGTVFDGAQNTLYIDNVAADPVAFTRGVSSPGTLSLGARDDGSNPWNGVIGETIFVNRDVTADERQKIHQWLIRHYTRVLVVEGDSLPHAGPSVGGYTYAYIPNAVVPTFLDNVAVGGSNLNNYGESAGAPTKYSTLTYRAPTHLYNRVPVDKQGKQYVLFFAITNNLGSDAAYIEAWGQYALAAKAAGFDKVVTATVLSRTDGQANDTKRNAFNAAIKASGWAAAHGIDAIADFASDPIMGVDAAPTVNPSYFADGVHPNAAGNARLEVIFRAAINGL